MLLKILLTFYIWGVLIFLLMGLFGFSRRITLKFFIITVFISLFSWFGIYYVFTNDKLNL